MINIGLIGYGYWGPNLARNFNSNPDPMFDSHRHIFASKSS